MGFSSKLFIAAFVALLALPVVSFAQNPAASQDLVNLINNIINRVVWPTFFFGVAVVFVWIGYLYLSAQGDSAKIATANKAVMWAVVGIMVALLAFYAINIINSIFSSSVPTGACCTSAEGGGGDRTMCAVTAFNACTPASGGSYMGNGTTCNPNPCTP